MKALFGCLTAVLISGCMGQLGMEGVGGGAGTTGGGSGSMTGGGSGSTLGDAGLPCEVASLLSAQCVSCHGSPLAGSAPMPLLSRADLMAPSARDPAVSYARRSVLRMRDTASAMPPGNPPAAALVDAFEAWVTAGMPEGSCGAIDAGPPELTCASNAFMPTPTPSNKHGSEEMAPGLACIACHSGTNFAGQNPSGLRERGEIYQFMGTVFKTAHEKPFCAPSLGIAATVEILDPAGNVALQLPVNSGGNFYGSVLGAMPSPYTARVVTSAGTRTMAGAQTNGDCNTCHTAEGLEGAPGRIYLP